MHMVALFINHYSIEEERTLRVLALWLQSTHTCTWTCACNLGAEVREISKHTYTT